MVRREKGRCNTMAADGSVVIEISGDDSELKKTLNGLKSVTGAAVKGLTTAVAAAGTAIAGLGVAAAKAGSDFEASLAGTSTMFGDVAVDTEGLKSKILDLSSATGLAATEISGSLYNALSAGIPVTEDMTGAMDYMEQCTKLAAAGFTDVDTAVTSTAKVMNAYGMGLDDVDKIQKIMLQTQNKGITTVNELGATLAQVTPTAAAMGVSFENVGAALATMTAQGTPTAQATTQLNALIAELGKSGTIAANNLTKAAAGTQYAGMSFGDMMSAGVPLNEVLNLMGDYADQSGLSMIDMFSSIEAGKAALAMAGENSEAFASNLAAMSTEADLVGDAYAKVTDTLEHKIDVLKESVTNLGIAVYDGMKASLGGAADLATDAVGDIAEAFERDGLQGAVEAAGGAMAKVVGEVSKAAPKLVDAAFDLMGAFIKGLWAQRGAIAKAAQEVALAVFDGLGDAVPMLAPLTGALSLVTKNLKDIIPVAGAAAAAFGAFKIVSTITSAFRAAQVQVTAFAVANGQAAVATAAANSTFKVTEIIVALMTKQITLAQFAAAGLKAVMTALAGPIGIAVMAVAAIGGGLLAYKLTAEDSAGATQSLSSRIGELNGRLKEQSAAQDDLATRRGEALAGIEAESERVAGYVKELGLLIDTQGRVKAGDEARAAQLAELINNAIPGAVEALATEEGAHYKISESIDAEILAMRKRMALQAMEEEYNAAMANRVQAQLDYADAVNAQEEAQKRLNDAYRDGAQLGTIQELTKALDEAKAAVQTSENAMTRYQDVISAFDTAMAAGSVEELDEVIRTLSTNIVKSTGDNQDELEKAAAGTRDAYSRMKQYNEAHWDSWDETERKGRADALAGLKKLVEDQEKELESSAGQATSLGIDFANGYAQGIMNDMAKGNVWSAAVGLALHAMNAIKATQVSNSPSKETMKLGGDASDGYAVGMRDAAKRVSFAAAAVAETALDSMAGGAAPREFEMLGWYTTEGFVKGMKDGEGEVIKTAAELSQAILKSATEWVDDKQYYNDLAAQDELAFWEDLKQMAGLEGKELAKIDRSIYKARQEASKESLEHSKKWIEQEKFYKRLSAEEEIEAWQRVVDRKNLLTAQQLEAERGLYSAQQTMIEEQTRRVEEYESSLSARENILRSFAGLFSEIDKGTAVSGQQLLKNLQDQVTLFEGWQKDMETIAGSDGMTEAFLAELREMGPKAANEIHALATMGEAGLKECVEKFTQLSGMIKTQAESELKDKPIELPIGAAVLSAEQAGVVVGRSVSTLCKSISDSTDQLTDATDLVTMDMQRTILARKKDFTTAGADAMRGLTEGLREQGKVAISTAKSIADDIIREMQRALDIHSPSRKMRDLVGKPAAQGFFVGFEDEMRRFHGLAQETIARETSKINAQVEAQVGARSVSQGVTREVHNNTKTVEKIARVEAADGISSELVRLLNVKLKAEDRRLGPSLA